MARIDDVERLNNALINDPSVRQRFREDPVAVVEEFGIELSEERKLVLRAENWLEKEEEELEEILHRCLPAIFSWF